MENLYLCHHGIKGQKWGIRRFQNEDGTLTEAGKKARAILQSPRRTRLAKEEAIKKNYDRYYSKYHASPVFPVAANLIRAYGSYRILDAGTRFLAATGHRKVATALKLAGAMAIGTNLGQNLRLTRRAYIDSLNPKTTPKTKRRKK